MRPSAVSRRRLAAALGAAAAYAPLALIPGAVAGRDHLDWAGSAIALAAGVLAGFAAIAGVCLAAIGVQLAAGEPLDHALVFGLAEVVGAITGVVVLRRVGFSPRLSRLRDVAWLAAAGAAVAFLVQAAAEIAAARALHGAGAVGGVHLLADEWLGQVAGTLLLAPLVLVVAAGGWPRRRRESAEIVALAAATAIVALVSNAVSLVAPAVVFPLLVIAALRRGAAGAATASAAVGVGIVAALARGTGPFADATGIAADLLPLSFLIATAGTALALGALAETAWRAERALLQEAARRAADGEQLERIVAAMAEGLIVQAPDGGVLACNERAAEILGVPHAVLARTTGRPGWRLLRPDGTAMPLDEHPIRVAFATGGPQRDVPLGVERDDGSVAWVRVNVELLQRAPGVAPDAAVATFADETPRVEAERALVHRAAHDSLTGVLRRDALVAEVDARIAGQRRLAIVLVDLDRMRAVNGAFGHATADAVLVGVAALLRDLACDRDRVARVAGDQFAILACVEGSADRAEALAEAAVRAIAAPRAIGGDEIVVTASAGVAWAEAGLDADAVLRHADAAMARAKAAGGNAVRRYDASMRARARERVRMESALHRAIERGELELHYQPKVALADGSLRGFEALVRWRHPELGLVPPGDFIPLAEETGLIREIGEWVIDEACARLARWGAAALPVAVNVSARQVAGGTVASAVRDAVTRHGVDGRLLELELTETVLMDDAPLTLATLAELRAIGCPVALDDFGTGFSSLSYLRRFAPDVVKVDRSLVDGLDGGGPGTAIVQAAITMAGAVGVAVVAEGIEAPEQVAELLAIGCGYGQGFHFSRPLPGAEADELVRLGRLRAAA